jgi:hypothetical protein
VGLLRETGFRAVYSGDETSSAGDRFAVAAFAQNWPQFRGEKAVGVADGQNLPGDWNIAWKTEIPGLGHSSTIVWGDRVFLTTAISSAKDLLFEAVANGGVDMRTDAASQQWRVYCLDRKSGRILWERLASEGVPKIHRHPHNSYASETPATDGEHVVVSFGSDSAKPLDSARPGSIQTSRNRLDFADQSTRVRVDCRVARSFGSPHNRANFTCLV